MSEPGRPALPDRLRTWYERLAFPPGPAYRRADPRRRAFQEGRPFVSGINLPWLTYGCDFGASRWRPSGGVAEPATRRALHEHLSRLAGSGAEVVRWFALCDGRSGIRVDHGGAPLGLDDAVLADLDAAAEALSRHGLSAIVVLFDFLLCAPPRVEHGVCMGGRRGWLTGTHADGLRERIIAPFVAHLGDAAPIAAWDLVNEPEWVTRGLGGHAGTGAVSYRTMRRFIGEASSLVRALSPFPVTVGLASAGGLELVKDVGLDVYQVHWYDRLDATAPLDRPAAEWRLDGPLLLGEYPTRGSSRTAADIATIARRCGYIGALSWSALSRDDASPGADPDDGGDSDPAGSVRNPGEA